MNGYNVTLISAGWHHFSILKFPYDKNGEFGYLFLTSFPTYFFIIQIFDNGKTTNNTYSSMYKPFGETLNMREDTLTPKVGFK